MSFLKLYMMNEEWTNERTELFHFFLTEIVNNMRRDSKIYIWECLLINFAVVCEH